ncbi:MAG: fumarylacetoacetate hydrolase family protein [Marinagarivorans sp.]|nr:fumarylacetoacetate hydrolase family protein [Marinagarivorans sp.]
MNNIEQAAQQLLQRRIDGIDGSRLDEALRPTTLEQAFAIQKSVSEQWQAKSGEVVKGWKCLLPPPEKFMIGAIYGSNVQAPGICSIIPLKDFAAIEPEFAFVFNRDLAPRDTAYSDDEVKAAIASVHITLELIKSRYQDPTTCEFPELLADGLFNQGIVVGPKIEGAAPSELKITVEYNGETHSFDGKHPNLAPYAPLTWLVNFLSAQGITLQAGQAVITGSYAGVINVPFNTEIKITYQNLGSLNVSFSKK